MPCSDGGPSREDIERERLRQRGLAVGLCIACELLAKLGELPEGLRDWYEAHKAADGARDRDAAAKAEFMTFQRDMEKQGLAVGWSHPKRQPMQRAYQEVSRLEQVERDETVRLSALKPG